MIYRKMRWVSAGCAELAKRIDREVMRFAYRDAGKGREQDAEASQAQYILRSLR